MECMMTICPAPSGVEVPPPALRRMDGDFEAALAEVQTLGDRPPPGPEPPPAAAQGGEEVADRGQTAPPQRLDTHLRLDDHRTTMGSGAASEGHGLSFALRSDRSASNRALADTEERTRPIVPPFNYGMPPADAFGMVVPAPSNPDALLSKAAAYRAVRFDPATLPVPATPQFAGAKVADQSFADQMISAGEPIVLPTAAEEARSKGEAWFGALAAHDVPDASGHGAEVEKRGPTVGIKSAAGEGPRGASDATGRMGSDIESVTVSTVRAEGSATVGSPTGQSALDAAKIDLVARAAGASLDDDRFEGEALAEDRSDASEVDAMHGTAVSSGAAEASKGARASALTLSPMQQTEMLKRIAERIEVLAAMRSTQEVTIRLAPNDLGSITLVVRSLNGGVDAEIYASEDRVRTALHQGQAHLAQALEGRGVNVNAVTVSVQPEHSSSQGSQPQTTDQHAQRQSHAPNQSGAAAAYRDRIDVQEVRRSATGARGVDLWI
jgi:hypothetical protein